MNPRAYADLKKGESKVKKLFAPIILATLTVFALGTSEVLSQEAQDQVKADLYKKFVDNRGPHEEIAYQAGKEYLEKYGKDNDKYTQYIEKWVSLYEREDRKQKLPILINQNNFTEAFPLGAKILEGEPDYLQARIMLAYAGYLAITKNDESHTAEALGYAREAIGSIESGKTPKLSPTVKPSDAPVNIWAPFKSKDDTLAYLQFAKAVLSLKTNPNDSIDALLKAASYESDIRKTPSTYYFLAAAYEAGPYKPMSEAYQQIHANKPETPESKLALEKLNTVMDRIIDAYARAIALTGSDPKTEKSRKEWLEQMTTFYKFRNGGSDAGITEFIAASLQKPLPAKP
jgi:tetratricopeptide (TPR) repeat protein